MAKQSALLKAFTEACSFPGNLDEQAVERALSSYLAALGMKRSVVRLKDGWSLAEHPSLARYVDRVLDDVATRIGRARSAAQQPVNNTLDARVARVARVALDALDALDARDAGVALDARDAGVALDARVARVAGVALDARVALVALDALDARVARVALDALDARVARVALDALDAGVALDALDAGVALDARVARVAGVALDALDAGSPLPQAARALHRFAAWCIQANPWGWYWRFDLSFMATTHFGALQLGHESVQRWTRPVLDAFLAGAWMLHFTDDTLYWVAKPAVHVETIPTGRRLHSSTTAALESAVERLYFWHGVLVPAFVVVRPDLITTEHIGKEENAEVRRVMMERYGYERYLVDIGAEREQADDFGELYRVTRSNDSDLVMVRVINSTAEPDGSFKRYMLRVPPHCRSAHEAVAWTWGLAKKEYAPAVET